MKKISKASEIKSQYAFILEALQDLPDFQTKSMFGCLGVYLGERLILVLGIGKDPWNGLMVPTHYSHHESLMADFPGLGIHGYLNKWLVVSSSSEDFESVAEEVIQAIRNKDDRFGVINESKKAKPVRKKTAKKVRKKSLLGSRRIKKN